MSRTAGRGSRPTRSPVSPVATIPRSRTTSSRRSSAARSPRRDLRRMCAEAYATFRHRAAAPLIQIGARRVGARAVPRADARLQGRRDAAARAADGPCPRRRGERIDDRRRDLRRHRRRGDRSVRRARAHRPFHPLSRGPRLPGPAAADDDDGGGECPCHRGQGHVRRLPGDGEGAVQRSRLPRPSGAHRRQLDQLGADRRADRLLLHRCRGARRAARPVSFTVPTGNFGDVFAGYVAKRMGLPIDRLIVATNVNDILARTLATGRYEIARRPRHHLAVDGHPDLVQLRAPALRGRWTRRRRCASPDGGPRRSPAPSPSTRRRLPRIRADFVAGRCPTRPRSRRPSARPGARPASSPTRTPPSALRSVSASGSATRRWSRLRPRIRRNFPRRSRPPAARVPELPEGFADLLSAQGDFRRHRQRPARVSRTHLLAHAGAVRMRFESMSVRVTTPAIGSSHRHARHAASRKRRARRLGRRRLAFGARRGARHLASPRAHGLQGHADPERRPTSPRRSRRSAAR